MSDELKLCPFCGHHARVWQIYGGYNVQCNVCGNGTITYGKVESAMKWYSVNDLLAGYSLPKWRIQAMCKSGELGAMRMPDNRYKYSRGQYFIPEGELSKLSAYKIGEPLFKEEHQPSEYLTPRNQDDEEKRMTELVGDYEAYLHSAEWRELQAAAKKRDGFVCQMCGTGKNLRVHHVNYEHVGAEDELEDVVTLCDECHSKVHVKDNRKEKADAESKNN